MTGFERETPFADPSTIELIVLDVDGSLTDGSLWYDAQGNELKRFNVKDGLGIRLWQHMGHELAIVTGRGGPAVRRRAAELGIDHVFEGSKKKTEALDRILSVTGLGPEQAACLADDWNDLGLMAKVGYPVAVADAVERVRAAAAHTTLLPGGHGAAREAIEYLLTARGELDEAAAMWR
ncbi:MAG: HAD hydrolase family protein [Planctomycetota bacterium]